MTPIGQRITIACVLALVWALPSVADAFYILSPKSEACHERLMLGSLQAMDVPFGGSPTSTETLRELFSTRAKARGVPQDEGTSAFVDEIAQRYALTDRPRSEQFVLASFVAGVRHPDTDGLSVAKFNETRSLHLQDQNQPLHSLRMSGHDYEPGDAQAVSAARHVVVDRVRGAVESWRTPAGLYAAERWSFPFYGEVDVWVFGPAFELGRASHVVQDAFAHALRDEHMRITSMGNFVDALQNRYYEPRDGPSHSDRLDECDVQKSAFDEMRITEARDATAALLGAVTPVFEDTRAALAVSEAIEKRLDPALDQVFTLRAGCNYENDYCDSEWTPISNSARTEPYDLTLCSADSAFRRPGASAGLVAAVVVSALFLWRLFRSRSRRATS